MADLKLYYIAATDPDDVTNDASLHVVASSPEGALAFWKDYYADVLNFYFREPITPGTPHEQYGQMLKIFQVTDERRPGALGPHTADLTCVGYVKP